MREIKFRAFSKRLNKMMYGFPFGNLNTITGFTEERGYNQSPIGHDVDVWEVEIMQYTGLKDKNGQEIYEGDIIRATTVWSLNNYDFISEVTFEDGVFGIKDLTPQSGTTEQLKLVNWIKVEVIGNIYENKDLLNSGISLPSVSHPWHKEDCSCSLCKEDGYP